MPERCGICTIRATDGGFMSVYVARPFCVRELVATLSIDTDKLSVYTKNCLRSGARVMRCLIQYIG